MEDGQYAVISGYLEHGTHPAAFTKSHKIVLAMNKLQKLQASKRQAVLQGRDSDGSSRDRLDVKEVKPTEFSRVSPHRERIRDATV